MRYEATSNKEKLKTLKNKQINKKLKKKNKQTNKKQNKTKTIKNQNLKNIYMVINLHGMVIQLVQNLKGNFFYADMGYVSSRQVLI